MNSFEKYVGQVFDNRYKITKILGIGGMAVVFEAFDTKLNRIVALKMLKDEIANDSQSVKRFINESKAVSMLSHPNIVSIYDVSVKDNLKYIVMERVDGITLKSYISQKGALSTTEALSYIEQILRALEHAHSKGIIHRDIKPQNIMLLKNGRIKVTDFGIAKLPNAETVTMTDKAIGTVYYISPEQASGKEIDQRSDLYSLGVMMYEMVTGELPFNADSPVSVALMQVNEKPKPPHEIKSDIPKGLEQIIMLAMEKQRERRFQNASQMLRHVLQIKAAPDYVFKTKKTESKATNENTMKQTSAKKPNKANTANKTKEKPRVAKDTMFPIVLAICLAFTLVLMFCGAITFNSILTEGTSDEPQTFFSLLSFKGIKEFFNEDGTHTNTDYDTVKVPNLVGNILTEEYIEQLEAKGFKIIKTYSDQYPNNQWNEIMEQNPKPGEERKMKKGKLACDIRVVLSLGDESAVPLKDYTTWNVSDAQADLIAADIKCEIIYEYSNKVDRGEVIRTSPVAGASMYKGDTVTITVSNGPENSSAKVPPVTGLTLEEATYKLEEAGFKVGEVKEQASNSYAEGTVSSQNPAAYTDAQVSEPVDIVISTGP